MSRWRTLIYLLLPITLLIPIAGWISYNSQVRTMRQLVSEGNERSIRTMAAALTAELNQRVLILATLTSQANQMEDPGQVLLATPFIDVQFDGGLAVFDHYGRLLAVQGTRSAAIQDWPTQITPPDNFSTTFRDPLTDELFLLITAPTSTRDRRVIGAISAPALAEQALQNMRLNSSQTALYILDESGQMIYTAGEVDQATATLCAEKAMATQAGTMFVPDTAFAPDHVLAYSPIDPIGWTIVSQEPWRSVVDNRFNFSLILPLIAVPVMLLAIAALWFGERQIIIPLQQLAQRAIALGQGHFQEIETDVGGIIAIRQLQSEMIAMSRKVDTAQHNLRSLVNALTLGQEEERRRLARELHDDTVQSLIALNQRIQLAQMQQNGHGIGQLDQMQQMVGVMIDDVRRFTQALRPIGLEELGLMPSLDLLVRNSATLAAERYGHVLDIELVHTGSPRRLPLTAEFALYRIAQEGINNAIRHGQATEIIVSLEFGAQQTKLAISDDGHGFTVPNSPVEMAREGHFGLLGMAERAQLINAAFDISSSMQTGTIITVTVPSSPNPLPARE